MSTATICFAASFCMVACLLYFFSAAQALPQFTRQYELKCSKCHLAPPMLNFVGRRYLQKGYRFFRAEREGKGITDVIKLDRTFPLGMWLSSQPYEFKNSVDQSSPFYDARLYIGGGIYRDVSAFIRLDLEEEKDYRFGTRLATVSYNPTETINARILWASITYPNLNDTLHSSRQLTLRPNAVISQPFGGADNNGTLASPRQGIQSSGWLTDHWFYTVGYSGNANDADIGKLSTLSGRLAFEILPVKGYDSFLISAGGFGMHGFYQNSESREFDRLAGDLQMDLPLIYVPVPGVIRLMGSYLWARDELKTGGFVNNWAWYAQANFISMSDGIAKWVPIVRFDQYTKDEATDEFGELTLNLTYYFVENFRTQLEHWMQVKVPEGSEKDTSLIFRLVFLY